MNLLRRERVRLLLWKHELASIKIDLRSRRKSEGIKAGFDPNQPRDDRGRWSGETTGGDLFVEVPARTRFSDPRRRTEPPTATDFSAARRRTTDCDTQYDRDAMICRMVQTSLCWQQAMMRRAACVAGSPIPPLNF
jgi:hypothetical protein